MAREDDTHSVFMGYLLWIFGFMGAHRFYYGRQISGTIWFDQWIAWWDWYLFLPFWAAL